MARRKQAADPTLPEMPEGLIEQLAGGVKTPADFQQVYRAFQKMLTEKALHTVFPRTTIHQCVVHLVRQSLQYVGWKERKLVAADLRQIYQAPSEAAACAALEHVRTTWGARFPQIAPIWDRAWERLTPALLYPLDVRRVLYTTNAIESLNSYLRKPLRTRGHFPNDDAASKLLYLVLRTLGRKWKQRPAKEWQRAVPHLHLLFGDRLPMAV
jgi:putative transposase